MRASEEERREKTGESSVKWRHQCFCLRLILRSSFLTPIFLLDSRSIYPAADWTPLLGCLITDSMGTNLSSLTPLRSQTNNCSLMVPVTRQGLMLVTTPSSTILSILSLQVFLTLASSIHCKATSVGKTFISYLRSLTDFLASGLSAILPISLPFGHQRPFLKYRTDYAIPLHENLKLPIFCKVKSKLFSTKGFYTNFSLLYSFLET